MLCIRQLLEDEHFSSLCGMVYSYSLGPFTGTQRESQSVEVNVDNLQKGQTMNAKHTRSVTE